MGYDDDNMNTETRPMVIGQRSARVTMLEMEYPLSNHTPRGHRTDSTTATVVFPHQV